MKKLLLVAILIAGTTLGFAKETIIVSKSEVQSQSDESTMLDDSQLRKICTTIWSWTTVTESQGMDGEIYVTTTYHTAQTTSWCGENSPRTTWVDGNPNP